MIPTKQEWAKLTPEEKNNTREQWRVEHEEEKRKQKETRRIVEMERMNMQKERETISVEKLALSNAYQLEAMINVLERKGLLTWKEVLDEMEVIAATQGKKEIN